MALGSTQPLVKMSTKGKGGWCVRLTTSPPSCAECREIWEPKPPGTLWATPGLLRDCFTFFALYFFSSYLLPAPCVQFRNRYLHYIQSYEIALKYIRLSKTYYSVYIYIYKSYIFVTYVMLKELDRFCFHGNLCCILRGPGGEPIVDVVSGVTELET
jgi:hypothetical protein